MPYDEALATRLRNSFAANPDIHEKKMFGGLAFMCRGHMFVGINEGELMARIGPDNYPAALKQPHVREMDFTGKAMKGYVYVAVKGLSNSKQLNKWTNMCLAFIDTLPPKK
ncbi:MAG: TfoX/Sxy family protein [Gallionella sp.]